MRSPDKISEIVKSIETKEKVDRGVMENPTQSSAVSLTSVIESAWRVTCYQVCLAGFKPLLKFLDFRCSEPPEARPKTRPEETRCMRQNTPLNTVIQNAEGMTHSEVSTQMVAFPQLAPFVHEMLVQEREVAVKKQELAFLKQLHESKKQDFQDSIEALNFVTRKYTFELCLKQVNLLKETIETYIRTEKKICEKRHGQPIEDHIWAFHTGIVEANRLKGVVCAIIPDIEKEIEWTQKESNDIWRNMSFDERFLVHFALEQDEL